MDRLSKTIKEAILQGKWLYLHYENKKKERTFYWAAILDISGKTKEKCFLKVRIYNPQKGDPIEASIPYSGIISAGLLDFTSYEVPEALIKKIEDPYESISFLSGDEEIENTLSYLKEANKLDNDPYESSAVMIPGIDRDVLFKEKKVHLNEEQRKILLEKVFAPYFKPREREYSENNLALSLLSFDEKERKYVVIYQSLGYDPSDHSLCLRGKIEFNSSFLIEGYRHSLPHYYPLGIDNFEKEYLEDKDSLFAELKETLKDRGRGELLNTRPEIYVLSRNFSHQVEEATSKILSLLDSSSLPCPIKAFFGILSRREGRRTPQPLLTYSLPDIKQLSVIYNALSKPMGYVQGPPGTGKTNTIFNLLISCFSERRRVLVTSYNNRPVDNLVKSLENLKPYAFAGQELKIYFPYLRLGNKEVNLEATKRILSLYKTRFVGEPSLNALEGYRKSLNEKSTSLMELLTRFEKRSEIEEAKQSLETFLAYNIKDKGTKELMDKTLEGLNEALKENKPVSNEEIIETVYLAKEDRKALGYLYFLSIHCLNRLKEPKYQPLIEILEIEDEEERLKQFHTYLEDDKNLELLTRVFPIIFSTNISSSRLGSGGFRFDNLIMDEAGQCDMATALIPMLRANAALIVGDTKQLRPIFALDPIVNDSLKTRYKVDQRYDYLDNSILSHLLKVDTLSKRILLKYHYRCGRRIISFNNALYYHNELELSHLKKDGGVALFDCPSHQGSSLRHTSLPEALGIVKYIKDNKLEEGSSSVAIFSPLRQASRDDQRDFGSGRDFQYQGFNRP